MHRRLDPVVRPQDRQSDNTPFRHWVQVGNELVAIRRSSRGDDCTVRSGLGFGFRICLLLFVPAAKISPGFMMPISSCYETDPFNEVRPR